MTTLPRDTLGFYAIAFIAICITAQPANSGAGVQVFRSGSFIIAQRSCKAAQTCRDAVVMWCNGYSGADRDNDGIPCENVCRSLPQVEAIKKEIGCKV